MKCPYCGNLNSKVIDSRLAKDGEITRRRRECELCVKRFTTYEQVEESLPMIIKKDGRREAYDRQKVIVGLKKACEKREISIDTIENLGSEIESYLSDLNQKEIPSAQVGEKIMFVLKQLDDVAYVRFASVYRSFKDIGEFVNLINNKK